MAAAKEAVFKSRLEGNRLQGKSTFLWRYNDAASDINGQVYVQELAEAVGAEVFRPMSQPSYDDMDLQATLAEASARTQNGYAIVHLKDGHTMTYDQIQELVYFLQTGFIREIDAVSRYRTNVVVIMEVIPVLMPPAHKLALLPDNL